MKAPLFVRSLTKSEHPGLRAGLRSALAFTLRRSQLLLLSAEGKTPRQIAHHLGCTDQTVRNVIRAFATGTITLGQRCRAVTRKVFSSLLSLAQHLFAGGYWCEQVAEMLMPA
jgi:DNA-binding CsgD family transcriptional regulator